MKVTLLLADAAQAVGGKLYILGGGWSMIGHESVPFAIAVKIEVPWDQTNRNHLFQLSLADEDGRPVMMKTPQGDRPVEITGNFEVGRPAGWKPGTPIDFIGAFNISGLLLKPDTRYVWRLAINGQTGEGWSVAFSTRPVLPRSA